MKLLALHGDILDQTADGLICSANPHLNLSGGVGGEFALRYGGGMQGFLHDYLRRSNRPFLHAGSVVAAPSFGSPYATVVHAVAIDGFYDTDEDLVVEAYRNAFAELSASGCRTVVAACLACGYGRFPDDRFASLMPRIAVLPAPGIESVQFCTTNSSLSLLLTSTPPIVDG